MLIACRFLKEQKQKTKSEEIVVSLVNYPGLISYKFNLIFFEYHLLLSKGQLKCFVSKFDFIQKIFDQALQARQITVPFL